MTRGELEHLLGEMGNVRAAVIGDVCLDAYWHADMRRSELSRETPHFARPVFREQYSGGALGIDWRARILLDILQAKGIDTSRVLQNEERLTPAFLKPILHGFEASQEAERFDFLSAEPPSAAELEELCRSLEAALGELDCVVVGDQVLDGVVTEPVVTRLCDMALRNDRVVFTADSRYKIERFAHMVWKPNDLEAQRALGEQWQRDTAGPGLLEKGARLVFMTVGEQGCLVAEKGQTNHVPAVSLTGPIDFVGAGDAFHAAVAASLAAKSGALQAACLGNLAAAVTVKKIGITGTARPDEILALFDDPGLPAPRPVG